MPTPVIAEVGSLLARGAGPRMESAGERAGVLATASAALTNAPTA